MAMWSYLLVVLLAVITPGPDTAVVLRSAAVPGERWPAAIAGVATGKIIHLGLVIGGLATILERSTAAFEVLRWAGVAYLTVLGFRSLRSDHPAIDPQPGQEAGTALRPRPITSYRAGLLANLTNPKTILFFASLVPQFTQPSSGLGHLLMLGLVVVAVSALWYSLLGTTFQRTRVLIQHSTMPQRLERLLGAVLLAFAGRLALAQRP